MLVDEGLVSQQDLMLFRYAETAQETWDIIVANHRAAPPA